MKEIPLTQGKVALVDDEDYEYINQWKWCALRDGDRCYAGRVAYSYVDGKKHRNTIRMHHLIIGRRNGYVTDHINRNGLDNTRNNLRHVTTRENSLNKSNQANLIGAYKSKDRKRYSSFITVDNKLKYLGKFDTPQEAHNAYMAALEKINNNNI